MAYLTFAVLVLNVLVLVLSARQVVEAKRLTRRAEQFYKVLDEWVQSNKHLYYSQNDADDRQPFHLH